MYGEVDVQVDSKTKLVKSSVEVVLHSDIGKGLLKLKIT
jgi:hypothetical protein